jgi:mannose-6-phosphate isomerase
MFKLSNPVMEYDWGSRTAIPALLGAPPTGRPQAEMWIGAHPKAPSHVVPRGPSTGPQGDPGDPGSPGGRGGPGAAAPGAIVGLDALIAADPVHHLGPAAPAGEVGDGAPAHLPFLLKLLAAERPLSLQVHPTREQARAGFAAEERLGIPRDAPDRGHRDANHKPEVICALTPFSALCGWRDPAVTARLLDALPVPALRGWAARLRERPTSEGLREVLAAVLRDEPDRAAEAAAGLTTALPALARAAAGVPGAAPVPVPVPAPVVALAAALAPAAEAYPGDPGLVVALLLNHVTLDPGRALHLDAGQPHAYLHGFGVELMAASDNVLRCGLTTKHVDAAALLGVVDFTPGPARPLAPGPVPGRAADSTAAYFDTPSPDFRLLRHRPGPRGEALAPGAPRLLLATEGAATLTAPSGEPIHLAPGEAAFVPAAEGPVRLSGTPGSTVFHATLPTAR